MEDRILEHFREDFEHGIDLDPAEAESLFDALITSRDDGSIASVLTAWNEKGWTEDELFSLVKIMRGRMRLLATDRTDLVDIVGTGGGAAKTFNVSTAAAFVIAGTGLGVAKHGNRAATSLSGSADVLGELGIAVDVDPDVTEASLRDHGLCFMFAPRFHSLSPTLAAARRSIGRPTIFNNLGPLCNPASVPHHVIGVWDKHLLETTANVLARLGAGRSWVVYGEGGLDEIALKGTTLVAEVANGAVTVSEVHASDFGVFTLAKAMPPRCTAAESAGLIASILHDQMMDSDAERLVLINAAAAIYVAGGRGTLGEAFDAARDGIRDGSAAAKLKALSEAGQ